MWYWMPGAVYSYRMLCGLAGKFRTYAERWISIGAIMLFVCFSVGTLPTARFLMSIGVLPAERFPCEGHSCGCWSSAQCWGNCCCFSPAERWAWADREGVFPPEAFAAEHPRSLYVRARVAAAGGEGANGGGGGGCALCHGSEDSGGDEREDESSAGADVGGFASGTPADCRGDRSLSLLVCLPLPGAGPGWAMEVPSSPRVLGWPAGVLWPLSAVLEAPVPPPRG